MIIVICIFAVDVFSTLFPLSNFHLILRGFLFVYGLSLSLSQINFMSKDINLFEGLNHSKIVNFHLWTQRVMTNVQIWANIWSAVGFQKATLFFTRFQLGTMGICLWNFFWTIMYKAQSIAWCIKPNNYSIVLWIQSPNLDTYDMAHCLYPLGSSKHKWK